MPRIIAFTLVACVCMLMATPAAEAQGRGSAPEQVWDAIDDWNQEFEEAFERRDAGALADLFTEDATIIEPYRPGVHGREAIRMYFEYYLDFGLDSIVGRTEEVYGDGDTAVEIGTSWATLRGSRISESRYMGVFKRQDDRWLLHRVVSNK